MTQYRNSCEGGTNLVTVTNANSGGTSGVAFTTVSKGSTSTLRFNNANPAHGSMGCELAPASTETNYVAWTLPGGGAAVAAVAYFKTAALPSAEDYVIQFRGGAGGSTVACSLRLTAAGFLRMLNQTGGASVLQTGTAITPGLGTTIRVEAFVTPGTTTSNGSFQASWFVGESLTPTGTISASGTFNTGVIPITQVRFGRAAAVTGTWPAFWDDFGIDDTATGFMGPVPGAPPTVVVTQAMNYVVDYRSTTPGTGGASMSYSMSQVSGPATTAAEPVEGLFIIVPDATATLVYTATIIETGGQTITQTITVPPLSATSAAGHAQVGVMTGGVFVF